MCSEFGIKLEVENLNLNLFEIQTDKIIKGISAGIGHSVQYNINNSSNNCCNNNYI
jgi:hypothetical protein